LVLVAMQEFYAFPDSSCGPSCGYFASCGFRL